MNDKTLVERLDIAIKDDHERGCQGRYYSCTCGYDNNCSQAMQDAKSRIEALEAEKAQMRRQGQDEGFAAAVQELRDMSARKPLPTLWHAASVLADSLEQSRIPCQALESQL